MSLEAHTAEIREIIMQRISTILRDTYHEGVSDLSEQTLTAKLAFKADPQLNELRLALERIERGEYGRCIFCKSPIEENLLLKNPTAHFCDQCSRVLRYRTSRQQS